MTVLEEMATFLLTLKVEPGTAESQLVLKTKAPLILLISWAVAMELPYTEAEVGVPYSRISCEEDAFELVNSQLTSAQMEIPLRVNVASQMALLPYLMNQDINSLAVN